MSRGVNPTAALFFAPYSSLTYMALPHGHYQCPCFLFFRIKNKKNRLIRRLVNAWDKSFYCNKNRGVGCLPKYPSLQQILWFPAKPLSKPPSHWGTPLWCNLQHQNDASPTLPGNTKSPPIMHHSAAVKNGTGTATNNIYYRLDVCGKKRGWNIPHINVPAPKTTYLVTYGTAGIDPHTVPTEKSNWWPDVTSHLLWLPN